MKQFFTLITLLVIVSWGTAYSQGWTYSGGFPTEDFASNNPGGHAVAVDPDGKIWLGNYYNITGDTIFNGTSWVGTRAIHVFNPDGSEASFSPILTLTGNGITDSLIGYTNRGMRTNKDGNILVSNGNRLHLLDYKTGEVIAKVIPDPVNSLTAAAVDTNGNVYIATVAPGNPIKIYTPDLSTYLGSVTDVSVNYSRSFEVSADGNSVYWAGYPNHKVMVYTRPDEYSPYEYKDSVLFGFDCESFTWSPDRTLLWASAGSYNDMPNRDPDHVTSYTPGTWYAWNPATNQIVDSINTVFATPNDPAYRPRALGFSPDYTTAYVAYFGGSKPTFAKFTKQAAAAVDITFEVDMGVQAFKGKFNPATDAVRLAGSFTDWATNALTMTDLDGDTVYTVTTQLTAGELVKFKFIKGTDGWESIPDREYTVPSNNATFSAFFDNDNSYQITYPVSVIFSCNMEYEIVSGRFDPATDQLSVRGSFNGWGSSDLMTQSVGDPNIYEISKSYNSFEGEAINYKFAYATTAGTTWEGGSDRSYTVTASDISSGFVIVPERVFNDLTPDVVTQNPVTIKFTVNMTGAVSSYTGQPFASIDDVRLCGANAPLAWPASGWPDTDEALTIRLYDDGTNGDVTVGDNVWSRDVVFAQYSPLRIEYKYGANWGLPSNTGVNDNESSVGTNHFINLTPTMLSATVVNQWAVMGDHDLINVVTDVENQIPGTPNNYELAQNYPNPFNPSTLIRYAIPEAGLVTLKVYNLLGEQVALLVDGFRNAGSYEVQFNASELPSGIYLYSITTNNFTSTKKMMLMK